MLAPSVLMAFALAGSQPQPAAASPSPPTPAAPAPAALPPVVQELPPIVKLGVRAETIRRQSQVISAVVIVPDPASFLAAVAEWRPKLRFPILIDDGSFSAREHIARFNRAFAPARVVRWKPADDSKPDVWPADRAAREQRLQTALARAWAAPEGEEHAGPDFPAKLVERYTQTNWSPPGLVVTSVDDAAWPAALALAAARGQLLTFIDRPVDGFAQGAGVNGQLSMDAARELNAQLERACTQAGVPHRGLGDGVDAVTLALDFPTRTLTANDPGAPAAPRGPFIAPPNTPLATSDVIGRHDGLGDRWAYAGQIWGSSPEALYRAMCAIFLQPADAWLFDGYENNAGWKAFDAGESAAVLKQAGYKPIVDDTPRQGLTDFRDRTAGGFVLGRDQAAPSGPGGVRAGLIAVNTSGQLNSFELKPGVGISADTPLLDVPALVYFVHSFSAQQPAHRWTIAGRFLDHGAFAYVGSVEEPYLSAFVPTPLFIRRLVAPVPLGAAARLDQGPAWRVGVFGDPLYTLGPPAPRAGPLLPLAGGVDLGEALPDRLRARDWDQVFPALTLLGRDRDLVRLATALLRDEPAALTAERAVIAAAAAFRAAELDAFCDLYERALGRASGELPPALVDMAWHAFWPNIPRLGERRVGLLGSSLRAECFDRDADEAARAFRRNQGEVGRRAWLEEQLKQTTDQARQAVLRKLLEAPQGR